jgi:diguanylate cyclase (GGDEF)-like protein
MGGGKMENMKKIFVVDDNDTNLFAAKTALDGVYKTYALASAAQMFKLAAKITPDLILLDIDMPEMNGFEAIKILKNNEQLADIPVIFLTAKSDEESELEGFALGAVDYVSKPFSPPIIKARIATQIKMVEQMRIIEQMGLIDTLTQIPNRRAFDSEINKQWVLAVSNNTSLGILMIDADKFKIFNDTHGHQQGDVALQTVSHVLKTSVRHAKDFAARWGGEEFAVILPDTDSETAFTVAENIRRNIQKCTVPCVDDASKELFITVSIGGYAIKPATGDTINAFVQKADAALYTAKENGRNRVYISEETT